MEIIQGKRKWPKSPAVFINRFSADYPENESVWFGLNPENTPVKKEDN